MAYGAPNLLEAAARVSDPDVAAGRQLLGGLAATIAARPSTGSLEAAVMDTVSAEPRVRQPPGTATTRQEIAPGGDEST